MFDASTATILYREILIISMVLLGILFVNNTRLYQIRISDPISMLLVGTFGTLAFEILWDQCDEAPGQVVITAM